MRNFRSFGASGFVGLDIVVFSHGSGQNSKTIA
jgi:hypothetical protein